MISVNERPVVISWYRLVSIYIVVITLLPSGFGTSLGCDSFTSPYIVYTQLQIYLGMSEQLGSSILGDRANLYRCFKVCRPPPPNNYIVLLKVIYIGHRSHQNCILFQISQQNITNISYSNDRCYKLRRIPLYIGQYAHFYILNRFGVQL